MRRYLLDCMDGKEPQPFRSYRAAVVYGQQHYGHGCFTVETPDHVPTREEQLLISQRQDILDSL